MRNDIAATTDELVTYSNGVVEILAVYSESENLLIATIYRQPDDTANNRPSNNLQLKPAIDSLKEAVMKLDQTPDIIIGGDFNLPHTSWPECSPKEGCTWNEAEMITTIQELCDEFMLTQIVTEPTHYQGNTLDLVFTNNDSLIHSCAVTPTLMSISHHHLVKVYTQYKAPMNTEDAVVHPRLSPLDNYNFHSKDVDWSSLNETLSNVAWHSLLEPMTVENTLDEILQQIHTAVENHVPLRSTRRPNKSRAKREKYNLTRRRRRINKQLQRITSPSRKETLHKELIQIEVKLYKLQESSSAFKEKKAIEAIKDNVKFFYSYANKKRKIKSRIGPLINKSTKKMTTDSKEMAEILADQYDSVFSTPTLPNATDMNDQLPDIPTLNNVTATPEDFTTAIKELKSTSATGPDGVPAILLLKCAEPISIPMSIFWGKSMEESLIPPDSLKFSMITPIHKGKTKSDPANYRPVALTSHLIKIYEKVLRNKIVEHIESVNGFNKNQHGFRKGRSCLTQLLAHHDNIINLLEEGGNVDVVYLDFAKAFDKVDHNIVLKKVQNLGIQGKLLQWIKEFLTNRTQSVMVNGRLSSKRPVISGVPQGSVIGPLLFLILISDIDEKALYSIIASFADDTRATKGILTEDDSVDLQTDLFQIYQWSINNNMEFNTVKFELLRYGKHNELKERTSYVTPEWNTIEEKEHVKDLGITMSSDATFKTHINNIIESAKRTSAWIMRTFKARDKLTMMTLYKSLVRPILEYASVLWSPTAKGDIQRIEEIQRSYIRKIRGVSRNYHEALKELKLYSLQRRRERYTLLQIWKMLEGHTANLNNTPNSSLQIARRIEDRGGRTLKTLNLTTTPGYLQKVKQQTVKVHGAKLFNSLPMSLRNTTNSTVEQFKHKLDKFLTTIEDLPLLQSGAHNGRANGSNHIYDCVPNPDLNIEHNTSGFSNNSMSGQALSTRRQTVRPAISGI